MWMKGSSAARSTPAKARRTGKPSPSYPLGAVRTARTARARAPGPDTAVRGRTVGSSTVTAGIVGSFGWKTYAGGTVVACATFPDQVPTGSEPQVAADDLLHDLGGAAVDR